MMIDDDYDDDYDDDINDDYDYDDCENANVDGDDDDVNDDVPECKGEEVHVPPPEL